MAIYMPPLCRKKKVVDRYNPDTFRVISKDAEDTHPKTDFIEVNEASEWRKEWLKNEGLALPDIYNRKTEVLPKAVPDFRIHRPHPNSCGFLRHNVRLLNEPICSVYTKVPSDDLHWWPSRASKEPLNVPPRTNDTIYREDFLDKERPSSGFGVQRHTANPNKEPALGTVPVNFLRARDGKKRFFKEKISYEHQYNSRKDPNYPIRAKRHGSFVWDQMAPEATKKFIDHYSVITAEEGAKRQEVMEANKMANEAALLLETNFTEQTSCNHESSSQQNPDTNIRSVSQKNSREPSPKNVSAPNGNKQSDNTDGNNNQCNETVTKSDDNQPVENQDKSETVKD